MIIADLIKKIADRINGIDAPQVRDGIDECDTCGQYSRLKDGLCDWCQKVYEANK
jgi:hypothetical protein